MRRRGTTSAAALAVLAAVVATPLAALALTRTPTDADEVDTLRKRSPKATALLDQGEALALSGKIAEADAAFKDAEVEYPNGSILWRRDCEMLTLEGRRNDALRACNVATETLHSRLNLRATLRALVVGPEPPKSMDLFLALALEEGQRHKAQGRDPGLVGTDCDIAESVGDGTMLQECANELATTDPGGQDEKRALALLAQRCPPWRFWSGWGLLLAAAAATAWHAATSSRRRRPATAMAAALLVLAGLTAHAGAARADTTSLADTAGSTEPAPVGEWLSKWPINKDDPASSIPSDKEKNAEPLQFGYWIQDLIMLAEHASKRGDHAAAAKFWNALTVAVPDRAVAFGKECEEYDAAGDHDRAIDACGQALLRDGLTVADYARFVNVVVAKPGPLTPKEVAALGQVLDHMKADDAARPVANELECEVGVRTSNVQQLQECTAALGATAPDDPKTISYRWALAMQLGKFKEASSLVEEAKSKGVQPEGVESMARTTEAAAAQYRKRLALWLISFVLVLSAAGLGARLLVARSRRSPQAA